jgi:phosphoglycerol transferase MdoB-like AlkP superfamily enzyme
MTRRQPAKSFLSLGPKAIIVYSTLTTAIICVATKMFAVYLIPFVHAQPFFWFKLLRYALVAAASEIVVVAVLGLAAWAIVGMFGRQIVDWLGTIGLIAAYAIIATINLANVEIARVLGTQLSVGLVYYSDIIGSESGRTALLTWVSMELWIVIAASILLSLTVPVLLSRLSRRLLHSMLFCLAPTAALVGFFGHGHALELGDAYSQSSTLSFLKSFRQLDTTIAQSSGTAPPRSTAIRLKPVPVNRSLAGTGQIKNVIWIVLESTAAQYLDIYQGRYGVTPGLNRLQNDALVVQNGYAHSVASHISLVSMLSSSNPWISVKTITTHAPTIHLNNVTAELQRHGLRTSFFHSSDTRHSRLDRYLARAGFDLLEDYRGRNCADGTIVDTTEFYSQATTDACTFQSLTNWIVKDAQKPFFAMLWTFQQHYPYFQTKPGRRFDFPELKGDEWAIEHKTRYLNAIAEADELISGLVENLRTNGLSSSTLIVISGDHGEAFRTHGSFGHGTNLYEEDIKVPIIMINPLLFPQRTTDRIMGHIDIAPTILDVLGFEAPSEWQGVSLFQEKTDEPIFFFTAWGDYLIGNRIGERKTIYRALANKVEVYDLVNDPGETRNIADQDAASTDAERQRIISWVADQNRKVFNHISNAPSHPPQKTWPFLCIIVGCS